MARPERETVTFPVQEALMDQTRPQKGRAQHRITSTPIRKRAINDKHYKRLLQPHINVTCMVLSVTNHKARCMNARCTVSLKWKRINLDPFPHPIRPWRILKATRAP